MGIRTWTDVYGNAFYDGTITTNSGVVTPCLQIATLSGVLKATAGIVSGTLMRTVATGASAFVAQMLAKMVIKDTSITDAVLFGGLMQTGSAALNAFLPGIAASLGLSGIVDANWSIPENPLRQMPVIAAPAGDARMGVAGLARAYGSAY